MRHKFPGLWTFSAGDKILVRKVTAEERKRLEMEESEKVLAEDVIQEMVGVSKLVRYISQSGKPLVGHNCLLGRK